MILPGGAVALGEWGTPEAHDMYGNLGDMLEIDLLVHLLAPDKHEMAAPLCASQQHGNARRAHCCGMA